MISLSIPDTKSLMSKLFKEDMFDSLFVANIELISFANFNIAIGAEPCTWQTMRPYVHNIIKGNKTPKSIKIVFYLNKEKGYAIAPDHEFFLNMYFSEGLLTFTTGTSSKLFSLDKGPEHVWEDNIKKFFKKHLIDFTELV